MARKSQFPPSVNPGIPIEQKPPKGWKLVLFGDVLKVVERPAKLHNDYEYQLVIAKRNREGIVPREKLPGKKILTKSQYYLRSGDFLISRRQIIHGACGIVPESLDGAIVSNEYSTLLPTDDLLLEYLSYYSHTTHFQQTCFHSSIGVDIEKMVFKIDNWLNNEMLLPPISEQQKICSILGSVDDAIQTTRSVIDQIQTIKQGLSQQLLTRGIGHKRFRKTEIGEIPESWDVVKLKNILSLEYGKNLKKEERDEGKFPVYGSNGIVGYHSDFLIEGPAIIVGRKGTIGAINWSNFNCWPIDTTYYVRVQNYGLDLKWIYYKLESLNLSKLNMATGIPGLNRDMVYTIKIGLPSVAEQSNISKRLLTVDNQIESYKKYLFHLQELKKYLIQDLLTGRVRVKLNEEVAV